MTVYICPDCGLEHDVEPCYLASADCDCCRAIDVRYR